LIESWPVSQFGHLARIGAVGARREEVRAEHLVERVDDLRDPQVLDVADGRGELAPEIAQQIAPQAISLLEMRSSCSSRAAVKSYST
jgi:2-polyprenyl-3-methyl-5-hydroxy-6-metoxy-1,4-benzoquinol methylase